MSSAESGVAAPAPSRGGLGRRLVRLLIVLACLTALIWTLARLGPEKILEVVMRADPLWLSLSVLPVLARFLIWGHKWRRILRRGFPDAPYWHSLRILLAGSFVNLTTPTAKLAGGVLRAALLNRHYGWGKARAYGRALVDQGTNALGTITLFGVLAVSLFLTAPEVEGAGTLLGAGLFVLIVISVGLAQRDRAWRLVQRPGLGRFLTRMAPARLRKEPPDGDSGDWVRRVFHPLLGEGTVWNTLLPDIGWAAVSFGSIAVANVFVLRALGVDANPWLVATAVVLSYFAGIAVGFGGVGVTEASLTGLYMQFGVPVDAAAAGALLHRATFYLVVLIGGGYSLFREGKGKGKGDRSAGAGA